METTQNQQFGQRPPGWYENYIPRYMAFLDEIYNVLKRSGGNAVKLPGAELMAAHRVEGRALLVADELGIIIRERRGWYKWGLEGEPGSADAIKILRRCTELRDEYTQRRRERVEALRQEREIKNMDVDDRAIRDIKSGDPKYRPETISLYGYPITSPKEAIEVLYRELDAAREQLQARR